MLVTVNNRLKFEIEVVNDLSCHPTELKQWQQQCYRQHMYNFYRDMSAVENINNHKSKQILTTFNSAKGLTLYEAKYQFIQ